MRRNVCRIARKLVEAGPDRSSLCKAPSRRETRELATALTFGKGVQSWKHEACVSLTRRAEGAEPFGDTSSCVAKLSYVFINLWQ